jgi:ABC-type nitrate/sulfonate/bicarbonate transport system substrate-binding protein
MRRTVIVTLVLLIVCGLARGTALASDKVRVGMLKPNVVTVIYWIAVRTRAFEKNGLEIEEHPFPSGQSVAGAEQLLRGGIDFYVGAGGEAARANSQSMQAGKPPPLAMMPAGDKGGTNFALANALRGKTVDDLKDQALRIGISSPSSTHLILFRAYLSDRHMTTNDLKWKFITVQGANMVPALLGGQLDGFMHDALTLTIALRAHAGFLFMSAHRGDMGETAQNLPNTMVIGSRAYMRAHPDISRRFVHALYDASDAYDKAPQAERLRIIGEWTGQEPAVVEEMLNYFDPRLPRDRRPAEAWWALNGAAMKARGEILDKVSFEDIFDLSYIETEAPRTQ